MATKKQPPKTTKTTKSTKKAAATKTKPVAQPGSERTASKTEWGGSFSAIDKAVDALRYSKQFLYLYVGSMAVFAIINYVMNPTPFLQFNYTAETKNPTTAFWVFFAVQTIVTLVLIPMAFVYQLHVARAKDSSLGLITTITFKKMLSFIVVFVLSSLAVVAGILFFILPGLYIAFKLIFTGYIVADKDVDPIDAMRDSLTLTKGNADKVLGFIGVNLLFSILATIVSAILPIAGTIIAAFVTIVLGIIGAQLYLWADENRVSE